MGKRSTPTDSSNPGSGIRLHFADLGKDETAPEVALYSIGADGKPAAKLAQAKQGTLAISPQRLKGHVAIGPDVQNLNELTADRLVVYRSEQIAKIWASKGLVLPRARWTVFWPLFRCVSGRVRKCRPWWWDIIDLTPISASIGSKLSKSVALKVQAASQISLASQIGAIRYFPWRCVPLCDGIIEIYERQCCCIRVDLSDLLDRLRDILQQIPIPWPPIPDPDPWPEPGPGPDPAPFRMARHTQRSMLSAKAPAGTVAKGPDPSLAPPERLYEAYADLQRLPPLEAERYALERPWLYPFFCSCSSRKVGEVAIQPGGEFDFCYLRGLVPFRCYLTYAYRIRQLIGGVWTTVYDGVASGAWFAADEDADIRVTNPRALPCGDPSGDPPPNEGNPFVMLEHVTGAGTHHFNFPTQTGVSQLAAPTNGNEGLYTTGYALDCPWGATLGLRLWVSPELRGTVVYYRMSAVPVDSAGIPTGARVVLDDAVSWSKFVQIGPDWVVQGQGLGPNTVGAESSLFVVPYWADGNWLSGQYHQLWNTAAFANGRYMLIVEVFDGAGTRLKPASAGGPGTTAFQFLRWSSDTTTTNVPFADCAHLFWIDNTAVYGDIVDLRQNGMASADPCQFKIGTPTDQFSIGYRAYHVNGVSNTNSFMSSHRIQWQRGLNGTLQDLLLAGPATTDVGDGVPPGQSGSATFGTMLGGNDRCSFSVTLSVYAKHWNGGTRLSAYDYYEIASLALDQTGP